jgi:excisionase family DNA binding protein
LKADDRVPEALAAIARSLSGCLESDELSRTFGETLDTERRIIDQANRLQLNLEELKTFFHEELWSYDQAKIGTKLKDRTYTDRLSARISIDNQEIQMINHSIYVFKVLIADRQRVASETILRFGATRKSARTNKNAAQTAAIGWLAEAVERIAGRPLTQHAVVLAQATLAIRDITEDRVREALRTRRREWRADR